MDKSASEHDIKRAYKRLSRKYHPDKNHEPDAESKFVEVAHGESYSTHRTWPPKTLVHSSSRASQHTRSSRTKLSVIPSLREIRLHADWEQKKQIYDRHGEEGLKAHEGGQHQYANPFDVFSQFFGGGCTYNYHRHWFCLIYCPLRVPSLLYTVQAQEQVRRGPTSVSEFEVSLADIYKGASIDVRPFLSSCPLDLNIPTRSL